MIAVNKDTHRIQSVQFSCEKSLAGVLVSVTVPGVGGMMMLIATFWKRRPKRTCTETKLEIKISVIKLESK